MIADLTGMRALVTGGGTGIGRGIAEVLAAQGAWVLVTDLGEGCRSRHRRGPGQPQPALIESLQDCPLPWSAGVSPTRNRCAARLENHS